MQTPTQKQIKAGNIVSDELLDASIVSGIDECRTFDVSNYSYPDLVTAYLNKEIDVVTAIWIAMDRAK